MQDEKQELMKKSAELEEMSCLDRARLVLDLEAQVKSLSDILARQENELGDKNREISRLQKLLISGRPQREEHTP